ncbi:hypothetical protein NUACC26_030810 [Scytonema sp. NUACC26]
MRTVFLILMGYTDSLYEEYSASRLNQVQIYQRPSATGCGSFIL